jgi:endonuclease YncB( thermonuclease family)
MALGSSPTFERHRRPCRRFIAALQCIAVGTALALVPSLGNAASHGNGKIIGRAFVIDGDTMEIQHIRIRLFGIDAPEALQKCKGARGTTYRCGQDATVSLEDMVRGKMVHCDQRDTDQYERAVAICTVDGIDLNASLVESGLAVAYRQYSGAYVPNEERARQARRGLWAGAFDAPTTYRRRHR